MTELVKKLNLWSETLSAIGQEHAGKVFKEAAQEIERLDKLINRPHIDNFFQSSKLEAAHQRERWGKDHDESKSPEMWFWTLGHLSSKALAASRAGDRKKALHHTISSAALLAHWHENLTEEAPCVSPNAESHTQTDLCMADHKQTEEAPL